MPLTFSHPAVVLPLGYLPRRWVSLTGLIAGSIAPDFEYFFRMKVSSVYSHTLAGMFWFDLPVGVALAFIYHQILKRQLTVNLPAPLSKRFSGYNAFHWNSYFTSHIPVVIISVLIGIASHLFWDSFTHITGYFVGLWHMALPVNLFGISVPLYKLVQHTSTLLGGIVIAAAIYKMPADGTRTDNQSISYYWLIVAGVVVLADMARIILGLDIHQYWNVLVTTIAAAILGVVVASVFTREAQKC